MKVVGQFGDGGGQSGGRRKGRIAGAADEW